MTKQYFSKHRKRWIDFGKSDTETEYKKFKYRIREKPLVKKAKRRSSSFGFKPSGIRF